MALRVRARGKFDDFSVRHDPHPALYPSAYGGCPPPLHDAREKGGLTFRTDVCAILDAMHRAGPCVLTLLALLAGCAPGRDLPPLAPVPPGPYRLGAGDELRIITVSDEALTGNFRINGSGDIELPMLGRFHAGGRSASGLGRALAVALRQAGLERDPSVAVEVVRYRPVFVLGEVNKPGGFPYQPGMTVLSAVALAGGFTYRAIERYAAVVRPGPSGPTEAKARPASALEPGDVVTVFERQY